MKQAGDSWTKIRSKCHPAIFELARISKELVLAIKALGPKASDDQTARLLGEFDKKTAEIQRKFSGNVLPEKNRFAAQVLFSEEALKSDSETNGVMEIAHWKRHKVVLKQDIQRVESAEWEASLRLQRTLADLEQLRCKKGPIRPYKENIEHSTIYEGLWGFGIEVLTAEELAQFFDEYCVCGVELHDSNALNKQRLRFKRALQAAIDTSSKE